MKKGIYSVMFLMVLVLGTGQDAQAQTLWGRAIPGIVDTGSLLDINIPGLNRDLVILGTTVVSNSTSSGASSGTYIVALDSANGNPVYVKPIPTGTSNSFYTAVVSITPLPDRTGDNVEEALVGLRSSQSNQIGYVRINGATGDMLPGSFSTESTPEPVTREAQFKPIVGDYDGNGVKDNYLIRNQVANPNFPATQSYISATR